MDSFHGCFKDDAAHDYRHFASLYLALRFVHPLSVFMLLGYGLYFPIASFLIIICNGSYCQIPALQMQT